MAMSMTKLEIEIQIALGTITNSQELAKHIKKSNDPEVLEWAIHHKNTGVRAAASRNPDLPIGVLIDAYVFENAMTVATVMRGVIVSRSLEAKNALFLIKDYPQLSLEL